MVVRHQEPHRMAPFVGQFHLSETTVAPYKIDIGIRPTAFDKPDEWSILYTKDAARDEALRKALADRENWPTHFSG